MVFKREKYVKQLEERKHNGMIKVITGSRRAGKSFIINELFKDKLLSDGVDSKHIIQFAFDMDEDIDKLEDFLPNQDTKLFDSKGNYKINSQKFRKYISSLTNDNDDFYLLLDEVQLLDNFVGTLNSYLRHKNFDVYVTGSNSKFLSSDIATEFKGRGSVVHVLPLSFSEYVGGLGLSPENAWKDYIETGGIPLVALMPSFEARSEYLKGLCEETYLKDIIVHNGVRKTSDLADLFDVFASSIGSLISPTKLVDTFKSVKKKDVSDDTISKFLKYFEDAFLISKVKRYSIKGRKYIGSPYKVYFEDIGVRNARLNFRQTEETHIMENIIYNELRYRGFNVDVGEVSINEKTAKLDKNGKSIYQCKAYEVDFIATKADQKLYIQSALSVSNVEKSKQEKNSLSYIGDSFEKIIITKDNINSRKDEYGIQSINLFDFLLNSLGQSF